jgi:outer membrane protein
LILRAAVDFRRRLGAALAVVAGAIAVASAAPAAAQTMEEALSLAYQNNPTLNAERSRLRATDEGVPQALSNWRPVVTLSGSYGSQYSNNSGGNNNQPRSVHADPRSGTLTATQNLYRGGRTMAATSLAENQVLSDRARLSGTEQTILQQAATAYMNVVRDQAVVELNRNNERVIERQLEATRDRFRVGEVTRTDVAQAESRLSRATADRIAAEGQLVQSRANFRAIVGEYPRQLRAAPPLGGLPSTEDEAIAIARSKNLTVVQADYLERAAKDQVDLVFGELLPTLSLTGQLSDSFDQTINDSETDRALARVDLSVPLYTSGSVESRIRAAKQTAAQRRDERNQAIRTAIEAATRAWESLNTARASKRAFTDVVRSAGIALDGVQQEALVGSRTVLDVLDAEQELVNAHVNLVRSERDEVVSSYDLRVSVGALSAESLSLQVDRYDPLKNYKRVRDKWLGWGIEGE